MAAVPTLAPEAYAYRTTRRYRSGPLAGRTAQLTTDRREAVGSLVRHTATTPAYVVVSCERSVT